jgi:hypothetical protein
MRVLTTWMYFDSSQVKGELGFHRPRGRGEEPEPGIGVAWFGGDTTTLSSISNAKIFRTLPGSRGEQSLSEEFLKDCLDLFLTDAEEFDFSRPERSMKTLKWWITSSHSQSSSSARRRSISLSRDC